MITEATFEEAVRDFHKADALEKQAKQLRDAARKILIAYESQEGSPFVPAEDSESGKTVECKTGNGLTARITHPTSAALPSRFDTTRTQEAYDLFLDADPIVSAHLFRLNPEFLPDAVLTVPPKYDEA